MKDTSFHGENLRRRARYIAVFSGLVIAFAVTVVLNINTGNVHISVPKIHGAAILYSCLSDRLHHNSTVSHPSLSRNFFS